MAAMVATMNDSRRPLPSPFARRSWRWQTARGAGVAATVLLALLVLVVVLPALRSGARSWLSALVPTPTAALAPGSDHFYFSVSVPWMMVSLDGRAVTLPQIGRDPPLALSRGVHQVEWRAAPFLPQSCLLSIPYSANNTCSRASYYGDPSSQPAVNLVLLDESLATLPAAQQAAVVGSLNAALSDVSDVVRPGEAYVAIGSRTYNGVATEPLRATLRFALDVAVTQPSSATGTSCQLSDICPFTPRNCSQFCTLGDLALQPLRVEGVALDQRAWYVVAFARLGWEFATLDGHVLAADTPLSPGKLVAAEFPLLFALRWDATAAAWHARQLNGPDAGAILRPFNEAIGTIAGSGSSSLADPGCAAMSDFVGPRAPISSSAAAHFISATNPAQGCLAVVASASSSAVPATNEAGAWYLYRFGVLLAANDIAHQASPRLPRADAYEEMLAAQIAASGA